MDETDYRLLALTPIPTQTFAMAGRLRVITAAIRVRHDFWTAQRPSFS